MSALAEALAHDVLSHVAQLAGFVDPSTVQDIFVEATAWYRDEDNDVGDAAARARYRLGRTRTGVCVVKAVTLEGADVPGAPLLAASCEHAQQLVVHDIVNTLHDDFMLDLERTLERITVIAGLIAPGKRMHSTGLYWRERISGLLVKAGDEEEVCMDRRVERVTAALEAIVVPMIAAYCSAPFGVAFTTEPAAG